MKATPFRRIFFDNNKSYVGKLVENIEKKKPFKQPLLLNASAYAKSFERNAKTLNDSSARLVPYLFSMSISLYLACVH